MYPYGAEDMTPLFTIFWVLRVFRFLRVLVYLKKDKTKMEERY